MSKITLDAELRGKLNGLNEQMEFCDEKGNTVGRFVPEGIYQRILYAMLKVHHTDEEVDELDGQAGGSTLQEIWQRLGKQ
jgi:hypothetical protein